MTFEMFILGVIGNIVADLISAAWRYIWRKLR